MTTLIGLDISAEVDVIDHEILFEIKETALTSLKSFFADIIQYVSVTDKTSLDVGLRVWCTTGIRFRAKELLYL